MDYSQDVLLDWSYKHPGPPDKSQEIHREWFKDRWRQIYSKKSCKKFLEVLKMKHQEQIALKLLIYYGLAFIILSSKGMKKDFLKPKEMLALGEKGYRAIGDEKKWRLFLESLTPSLNNLIF